MTKPPSRDLAPSVPPIVRDYISALLEEQMAALARDLAEIVAPIQVENRALKADIATLRAQVNTLSILITGAPTSQRRLAQILDAITRVDPKE